MKKLSILLVLLLLSLPVFAVVIDKIVATVNGEPVTLAELEKILQPVYRQGEQAYSGQDLALYKKQAKRQLLDQLIENKLILQIAEEDGIEVTEAKMEEELADIKDKFGSMEAFEEALKAEGLTLGQFKKDLTDQILVRAMLEREVVPKSKIMPEEIKAYYSDNHEEFLKPEMVRIGHILIKDDEAEVQEIYAKLETGEDFTELARQYSDIGDPGLIPLDKLKPELREIIEPLKVWEYSPIIKTEMGWHIIQLKERTSAEVMPLSEIWDSLENFLFRKKMTAEHEKWVNNLRYKAHIIIEMED